MVASQEADSGKRKQSRQKNAKSSHQDPLKVCGWARGKTGPKLMVEISMIRWQVLLNSSKQETFMVRTNGNGGHVDSERVPSVEDSAN